MTPLGPMNGKSFGTSISPWVITLDALQPFKSPAPPRNPDIALPAYLRDPDPLPTFKIELKAEMLPENAAEPSVLCQSSFSSIYWTLRDLVAQQTVNGCCVSTGDLLATGTISGEAIGSNGCLMEIAAKGGIEVRNRKGENEKLIFFRDGDTVSLSAYSGNGVGFGDCVGTILPAK
jgi:fumarylacetoacetase